MSDFDVMIVGSGIVGAVAALSLAETTTLQIAIIDAQPAVTDWQADFYDARVSAVSLASQRIFSALDIWDSIKKKRITPYKKMHVWEEAGSGEIHFDAASLNQSALGCIIEDNVMRSSLHAALMAHPRIHFFSECSILALTEKNSHIELQLANQKILTAKLLVAADGANSWVRKHLNIPLKTHDYHHTAIIATVKSEKAHDFVARQRFLKTGPLAFLPLQDSHTSSIVWSATPSYADELLALEDELFQEKLSTAFENKLGKITAVTKRYHFPLRMRHVKQYVKSRIALIGDAAHTIHPLAGQGVNMGLLDAVCLSEVISDAILKRRDFSSLSTLRRYERWRKSDNLGLLVGVDVIKKIFETEQSTLRALCSYGLDCVDRFAPVKHFFAHYALGNRGDLPRLAQN